MGIGKMLAYTVGGVVVGVGAIAAAPFTGGGSVLAAVSLGASLAGTGTIAAAAGAATVVGGAGAYIANKEDEDEEKQEKKMAEYHQKAQKAETALKEHEKHTNLILALSALGCAMANADGEISPEEIVELKEFVGGIASQGYPALIVEQIEKMISNPPTFNEAMEHLSKVEVIKYQEIRNFLVMVMESDGIVHKKEEAFLKAFDIKIAQMTE